MSTQSKLLFERLLQERPVTIKEVEKLNNQLNAQKERLRQIDLAIGLVLKKRYDELYE